MIEIKPGESRAQDGCVIRYQIYPQPGQPRVVFIHSLALDGSIWDGVRSELGGADIEALVYDCRGHGRSERRPGPYTVDRFADDLAAILDDCGWTSAVIVGCSMGGCVAQAFAGKYPDRALGLALLDTTAWYGPTAPEDWRQRGAKATETGLASMLAFQVSRWFSEQFPFAHPEAVASVSRVFLANDIACYQGACSLLGSADLRAVIKSFRMPVSVIVGEQDYATPVAMAQQIHDSVPGSTLTVIPGGRHLTPVECPRQIVALLKDLLGRVTLSRSA